MTKQPEVSPVRLSQQQLTQYDRDGFLIFPELFAADEIATLREELARFEGLQTDHIVREKTGEMRTIFRMHEEDGPTASRPFRAMSRMPRLLQPATQVLGDDELYIYHSKCNVKVAIEGTVWLWHQDYGYWVHDGVPTPNMATFMVMLDAATELGGCLYFLPGSHRLGRQESVPDDTTTSYRQWVVPKAKLVELLNNAPSPVPIAGKPGTAALFHCNILHASGHNLSPNDRWHIYFAYNPIANKPNPPSDPRPAYVVSRNYEKLELGSDDALRRVQAPA